MRIASVIVLALMLAGCGGGENAPGVSGDAAVVGTLAYAETLCREEGGVLQLRQALRLQQGERAPVTVRDMLIAGPLEDSGVCALFGAARLGPFFQLVGVFQRLAVSPDGSTVVFEITDDFSLGALNPLDPEAKGMFAVQADGSGLRRLGPASREAPFGLDLSSDTPYVLFLSSLAFSPDGKTITFTDRGMAPEGEETAQIFVQDVTTGQRTQVTQLPAGPSPSSLLPPTCCPVFIDDETVGFSSFTNPDGLNPDQNLVVFTVKTDGTDLRAAALPLVAPGSQFIPTFSITGDRPTPAVFLLLGEPVNPMLGANTITEVFLVDGPNLLQLTNFRRVDTGSPILDRSGTPVYFTASADPFGHNPTENCQIFTVDATGAGVRQLTEFSEGAHSQTGCTFAAPPGCAAHIFSQDALTGSVLFYSSCDPTGANPNGGQVFAMRPNGSGIRQLTQADGYVTSPDGSVLVDLPGPFAFSGQ